MQKVARKILRTVAGYDPAYYDMYADANERFFAQLYLKRIQEEVAAAGIPAGSTVLDAGCQAGRLAIPLAQRGFQVTGIDASGFAVRRARQHARDAGVQATFLTGDLQSTLQRQPHQYDVVICAEVIYLSPAYRAMLQTLAAAVRPGGILCVSHRPKFYYLFEAIRRYDLVTASEVLNRGEGPYPGSRYYNWQTEDELRVLYGELGLEWRAMYPIDRFAWLTGMSPSQLSEDAREQWLRLELQLPHEGGTCARYVLVVAGRPQTKGAG